MTERLGAFALELPRDPGDLPMTGAAGGLAGGLWAHGATLRPGADFVLDVLDFDDRLARADAVLSDEGRFDRTASRLPRAISSLRMANSLDEIKMQSARLG